jgi:nicotinamide-nucleotide amidase
MGSIVAYGNEAKKRLLKVRAATINTYGAVSAETAVEMAEGARVRLRADVAVAITGIAGPGGGSAEKPVGTVFICVTGRDGSLVRGCLFKGSRRSIKKQTVEHAIDAVLDFIEKKGIKK